MKYTSKVFVIVYRKTGESLEFLCLLPSPEINRNSDYYVITGDVEKDESLQIAALREVKEEIGIKSQQIISLNNSINYKDAVTQKYYTEYCFAVKINNELIVLNEEHVSYKWVGANEFVDIIWWDKSDRSVIKLMLKIIMDHES